MRRAGAMSGRVVVVGSYVAGLTIRADRLPVPGETVIAREWDSGPGGKGSNQAVQVARLRGPVEIVARIGRDQFGEVAQRLWSDEGVLAHHVVLDDTEPTGVAFIMLDADGANSILVYPGANAALSAADVDPIAETLSPNDVVVAQQEISQEPVARALELGRRAGATTILNPAPARVLDPELPPCIDILTPNASEARLMLGLQPDADADPRELAEGLLELGVRTVVLTLGADGALITDRGGHTDVPAVMPSTIVDTTGAGDAFTGALAAMLARGAALADAVRASVIAGALACTAMGVVPALPDLAALQAGGVAATEP